MRRLSWLPAETFPAEGLVELGGAGHATWVDAPDALADTVTDFAPALWRSGALALWRSGALALWRSGALALWRFDPLALWRPHEGAVSFPQHRVAHDCTLPAFAQKGA